VGILAFGDVGPVYGDIFVYVYRLVAGKNRKAEE
jgi:hypothetical protein